MIISSELGPGLHHVIRSYLVCCIEYFSLENETTFFLFYLFNRLTMVHQSIIDYLIDQNFDESLPVAI